MFVWNMGQTSAPKVLESPDPTVRRQKMTTWGIVALAVFVAVGMAEWSKRTAAGEVIVDEKILQQAMAIAAEARDSGVKGLRDSESGKRKAESEKRISKIGNEAATIQTSEGVER